MNVYANPAGNGTANALKTEDFICLGYIKKKNNMASLILAKYSQDHKFVVTNHVTVEISLNKIGQYNVAKAECPIFKIPKGCLYADWIESTVCTVGYVPLRNVGIRRAVFKEIRKDKRPEACTLK